MWKTIAKWFVLVLAIIALVYWVISALVSFGSNQGKAEIQKLWDADKQTQAQIIADLRKQLTTKEGEHRAENERINTALADVSKDHALAIAAVRAEYSERVRKSEGRAAYYQRMSEAGPAQCTSLAGHAAQLDRALEEGRSLVRELRETLGQRDAELILLGDQITNDRNLLTQEVAQ